MVAKVRGRLAQKSCLGDLKNVGAVLALVRFDGLIVGVRLGGLELRVSGVCMNVCTCCKVSSSKLLRPPTLNQPTLDYSKLNLVPARVEH